MEKTQETPGPKNPTDKEIKEHYITKRAAALVIVEYIKTNRSYLIGSILMNFTYLGLSYIHPWAVFLAALTFASTLGWFLYGTQKKIAELVKTYSL
jgi:hypothetical protein